MNVVVLRLGHRISRDHRISMHCGLTARALCARGVIYSGDPDESILKSVNRVTEEWGGKFHASYEKSWKKVISDHKRKGFVVVHLSTHGVLLYTAMRKIKVKKKILAVLGGEDGPWEMYELADLSVAITNEPHSEIAALALFMDRAFGGKEMGKKFPGAKKRVVPQERGKKVIGK
jgi:tRNA (cytidine56-2'-O)-methyltransferase